MATKAYTVDSNNRRTIVSWAAMATGDDGTGFIMPRGGVAASVHFTGTFANGTDAALQGSNDGGATWVELKDVNGNAVSATAAAIFEISTAVERIRPIVTVGSSDSVIPYFAFWNM